MSIKTTTGQTDHARLDSSVLESAAYTERVELLELEFTSGSCYHYHGVPRAVFEQLLAADSHGAYFNREIRRRFSTGVAGAGNPPSVLPMGCD